MKGKGQMMKRTKKMVLKLAGNPNAADAVHGGWKGGVCTDNHYPAHAEGRRQYKRDQIISI